MCNLLSAETIIKMKKTKSRKKSKKQKETNKLMEMINPRLTRPKRIIKKSQRLKEKKYHSRKKLNKKHENYLSTILIP
jgi:hypothetical protein